MVNVSNLKVHLDHIFKPEISNTQIRNAEELFGHPHPLLPEIIQDVPVENAQDNREGSDPQSKVIHKQDTQQQNPQPFRKDLTHLSYDGDILSHPEMKIDNLQEPMNQKNKK